jgi:bifunctional non-homologous end joining protein LigD
MKRGDRRLAVQVEDHPLEYGNFEGTIAEGNYGAGTVMVWDQGTYNVLGEDPEQALEKGKVHFALEGKKLKGEWTLVRMRHFGGSKPQWLMIKSGTDLPPLSERAEHRSALTNRTLEQIAHAGNGKEWKSDRAMLRRRSPKLPEERGRASYKGTGPQARSKLRESVGTRAHKIRETSQRNRQSARARATEKFKLQGLSARKPEFVEPMKALLEAKLPRGPEWVYEVKFDGVRALAIKNNESLALVSRAGNDLGHKYPEISQGLKNLSAGEAIIDGEVVAVDAQGRSSFQLLQSYQSAGTKKPPLFYYVFDLIQLDGKDVTKLPLSERKAMAQKLTENLAPAIRFSGNITAESARLLKEMQSRGLEGLIAKKKDSRYEPGRRSGAWVKFKWTNEQEFVIGGYTRPKGARSHFGAILVGYYQNKRLLFAGKIGTGFNEATLRMLYEKFQQLASPDCPFANLPEKFTGSSSGLSAAEMRRCQWLRPELVCQARFAEWTRDHHLRQPAYLGLREDKDPREVVREKPV